MLLELSIIFSSLFFIFVYDNYRSGLQRNLIFLLTFFLVSFLVAGCTTIHYKESGAEFSKTTFGTQLEVAKFTVDRDPAGRITFNLEGYKSDQVQAIEATAKGVAEGLAQGAKP